VDTRSLAVLCFTLAAILVLFAITTAAAEPPFRGYPILRATYLAAVFASPLLAVLTGAYLLRRRTGYYR
jgi:hypothetical protein